MANILSRAASPARRGTRRDGAETSRNLPRRSPGARVLAGVLDHASLADLRVHLGGRDVGVAEHRLDGAQVGAVLEEVCGERVAQLVGRYVARRQPHIGATGMAAQRLPEPL